MARETGMIFDIQRFALHDGPGIRTTVFFMGCSNRCGWCHNPESISGTPALQYYPDRCVRCGACFAACARGVHRAAEDGAHVLLRDRCAGCGACASACPVQALMLAGREASVDEVMRTVLEDAPYYAASGGGVTLSGGEPVLQAEFARAILEAARGAGIHTALETAGFYPPERLLALLAHLDLVLFDLKAWDDEVYRQHIGGRRAVILESLKALDGAGVPFAVRTPVVGGVNDSADEIAAIARHIQPMKGLLYHQLIKYHALGKAKYDALGLEYAPGYREPSDEEIERLERVAADYVPVFNAKRGYWPRKDG